MAQNNQESNNYKKLKIVLLGDRAVGKSSIIQKYITNKFQ
jgi:GTPase SAR1 family protein